MTFDFENKPITFGVYNLFYIGNSVKAIRYAHNFQLQITSFRLADKNTLERNDINIVTIVKYNI